MNVLDLFSGIGGFSLGLERAGMKTVAFCEIEDYPVKILNKHWPGVPVFRDVRKLTKESLYEVSGVQPDIIVGGFPCQPFSVAGKQAGKEDDRHLWPEMFRLIKEIRPRWVIGENVAGFVRMALDDVLSDLESEGYRCQAFVIPACAVGAIHRRDRVWIVANSDSERGRLRNTEREYAKNAREPSEGSWKNAGGMGFWDIEPRVGRVANGIPNRVARLKALGNAVVPQIPEIIGRAIMAIENE